MGCAARSKGFAAMQLGLTAKHGTRAVQTPPRTDEQQELSSMTYRITGLDPAPFQTLFALSDEDLASRDVVRMTVTEKPSFPCRVTLQDREIGEQVLLLNHVSHDGGPYHASHAIFVSDGAAATFLDEVPPVFNGRVLSLRAFDDAGLM